MPVLREQEKSVGGECRSLQPVVKVFDIDDESSHDSEHGVGHIKLMLFAPILFAL